MHETYYQFSALNKYLIKENIPQSNLTTDVFIIGGGFSGISTALHLAECGIKSIVVEQAKIGAGASGKNGGQVSTGQRIPANILQKKLGSKKTQTLWQIGNQAAKLVQDIIKKHNINCQYHKGIYYTACKNSDLKQMFEEVDFLNKNYQHKNKIKLSQNEIKNIIKTNAYKGAVYDLDAAHLHPLNFLLAMAKIATQNGVKIFQNTKAVKWEKKNDAFEIYTNSQYQNKKISNLMKSSYLVFCCNAYLDDKLLIEAQRYIIPIHSYIVSTKPLKASPIKDHTAVCDSKAIVEYYKMTESKRLIFGGGESYFNKIKTPEKIRKIVQKKILKIFPELEKEIDIEFAWGAKLAITNSKMPVLGNIYNKIFFLQGYSGAGIAMAVMAGKMLAEKISKKNDFFDIVSNIPSRPIYGGKHVKNIIAAIAMKISSIRDRI